MSQNQIKIFRTLLYCYPAEFRHEYGAEMEQLFAGRLAFESRFRLWTDTLADVGISAAREHLYALLADAKHGLRLFAAQPAFTALIVLVIAVGIAACVSVFSLSDAVLFRSFPYAAPDRLVYLWSPNYNFKGVPEEMGPNLADIVEWQKHSTSFSSIATFNHKAVNLVTRTASQRMGAAVVSGAFFATLGVQPELGRTINASDDQPRHDKAVVISDNLWRSRFSSDTSVIGRLIQLDRDKYTVIGVMPPGVGFPFDGDVPYEHSSFVKTDMWIPAAYTLKQKTDRINLEVSPDAIARLRPGTSAGHAEAELRGIQAGVQSLYPPMWRGFSAKVVSLVETIVGPVRRMFWILLGAVGVVMLVAIANAANLLLARTAGRAHELGIRTALGAERARIVRQLLTESIMLSSAGGAAGVALSYALVRLLVKLNPGRIPRFETAGVDTRALFVAVLLSVTAGVLAGIAPAVFTRRINVNAVLRRHSKTISGGYVKSRFVFITAEIALSVILLAGSGLLIRSYLKLAAADPGFAPSTLTFGIPLDDRYNTAEKRSRFYADAHENFRHIPGVRYIGESNAIPLTGFESVSPVEVEGHGRTEQMIQTRSVTPQYRKALGMSLLQGRDFSAHDVASHAQVALINRQFAALYLPGREPIGTRFRIGLGDLSTAPWWTVVGVVGNIAHRSLEDRSQAQILQPSPDGDHFAIACNSPDQVARSVGKLLRKMDPVLTLEDVQTMRGRMQSSNARRTFQTALLTSFSFIALLLALTGLYGLMSYLVRLRTAEIGLRLALGSPGHQVIRLILIHGLKATLAGLIIGTLAALALTRLISSWLFEVKPLDTFTFAAVALAVLFTTCCGCLFPAWSATRIEPAMALRQE